MRAGRVSPAGHTLYSPVKIKQIFALIAETEKCLLLLILQGPTLFFNFFSHFGKKWEYDCLACF